jgi:hypothetical protein
MLVLHDGVIAGEVFLSDITATKSAVLGTADTIK